jgi:predicted nucleotidyltransferase component of viral defense system
MAESRDHEAFMIYIINLFADKFKNHAVLKGGMELRLLNCPRHTNDIDYTFVPFSSKKEVRALLQKELDGLEGIRAELSLNSKCLVCRLRREGVRIQVEINAARECKSEEMSTMDISKTHQQQGRIIRAMRLDAALAFKLAAWNERRIARDLYDIYFISTLADIRPDRAVLEERLSEVTPPKGVKGGKKSMTVEEFTAELEGQIKSMDVKALKKQLMDYLAPDHLPGLDYKIKVSLGSIVEYLRS